MLFSRQLLLFLALFLCAGEAQETQYYDCSGVYNGQLTQQIPYKGCYTPGQGVFVETTDQSATTSGNTSLACYENIYSVVGATTFTPWTTPNGQMYVKSKIVHRRSR
jgi:hypothetical protein